MFFAALGQSAGDGVFDALGSADRDGGLVDDDGRPRQMFANGGGGVDYMANIRRAVLVGWRADRDEHHVAVIYGALAIDRKPKPSGIQVRAQQRLEARLEDRHVAGLQARHLGLVDVHA